MSSPEFEICKIELNHVLNHVTLQKWRRVATAERSTRSCDGSRVIGCTWAQAQSARSHTLEQKLIALRRENDEAFHIHATIPVARWVGGLTSVVDSPQGSSTFPSDQVSSPLGETNLSMKVRTLETLLRRSRACRFVLTLALLASSAKHWSSSSFAPEDCH